MENNLMLTGKQGIGKSTILRENISLFLQRKDNIADVLKGFYVQELFVSSRRYGFRLVEVDENYVNLDQKIFQKNIKQQGIINKNNEDLGIFLKFDKDGIPIPYTETFEITGTQILRNALSSNPRVVLLDELGRFELPATSFRRTVWEVLNSDIKVIGVIKKENNQFLDKIRTNKNVKTIDMDITHPDHVSKCIMEFLLN